MTSFQCPNVIIGGGPAGAAAAILLARQGEAVCLFERKTQAHHKVCGEFVSWEAAQYLERLGLDLRAMSAHQIRRARLFDGEKCIESTLPFTAWSLSRKRLDEVLLQTAESAGAELRRGTVIRALEQDALGKGWKLKTDRHECLDATRVFLASGKYDLHEWRRPRRAGNELIGFKMHLELSPRAQRLLHESVEIHLYRGGYIGLELVDSGRGNLCFLMQRDRFQQCDKEWPKVLHFLCQQSSHLEQRLHDARCCWPKPLAVHGTPYGYVQDPATARENLFCLGDQFAVIPSFAGDGIAIALHSAFLAARSYFLDDGHETYSSAMAEDVAGPLRRALLFSELLDSPLGRRGIFFLGQHMPGLFTQAISSVRLNKIAA